MTVGSTVTHLHYGDTGKVIEVLDEAGEVAVEWTVIRDTHWNARRVGEWTRETLGGDHPTVRIE